MPRRTASVGNPGIGSCDVTVVGLVWGDDEAEVALVVVEENVVWADEAVALVADV